MLAYFSIIIIMLTIFFPRKHECLINFNSRRCRQIGQKCPLKYCATWTGSVVHYTPHLETESESKATTYEFYNEYNRRIEFDICREYGNKSKIDEILTSRRFACFKECKRDADKRD